MGISFSRIWQRLFRKKEMSLLMVGLDAVGKTTILYRLQLGKFIDTIPTIGFNAEKFLYKNINFTMWDPSSRPGNRSIWRYYYTTLDGLIFVVDSSDRDRVDEAADIFQEMLNEELLQNAVVLMLANKQDKPNAMTVSEIYDKFRLSNMEGRDCFIQSSCAFTGDGLFEGMDWLSRTLSKKK